MTCHFCKAAEGREVFQPVQTYERHMEVTFHIHVTPEGEEFKVPVCRACAIKFIQIHMDKASPDALTFWA